MFGDRICRTIIAMVKSQRKIAWLSELELQH